MSEIQELVKEFLNMLEEKETSDQDYDFYPTYISSCRLRHTIRLDVIFKRLKELTEVPENGR